MFDRKAIYALILFSVFLSLFFYPVSSRLIKAIFIFSGVCFSVLFVFILRNLFHRGLKTTPILLILVILLVFIVSISGDYTKKPFSEHLVSFKGTRYVWGGENKVGIDCSGLIRASMMKKILSENLYEIDVLSLKILLNLWWNDFSARDMKKNKLFLNLGSYSRIENISDEILSLGDIAITSDGVHCLAYVGGGQWIHADPNEKKVVVDMQINDKVWFHTSVNLVRWKYLKVKNWK